MPTRNLQLPGTWNNFRVPGLFTEELRVFDPSAWNMGPRDSGSWGFGFCGGFPKRGCGNIGEGDGLVSPDGNVSLWSVGFLMSLRRGGVAVSLTFLCY